jgi:hypothetical protein
MASAERLETSCLNQLKFCLKALVFLLLLVVPLEACVGKILRLERILQTVIHLPLAREHARGVAINVKSRSLQGACCRATNACCKTQETW